MQIEYSEREIKSGVKLKMIKDSKFKSNIVSIKMLVDNDCRELAALAILPSVLSYTNKNYPTSDELNRKLNELYGMSLFSSCGQRGDMYELSVSCEYVPARYTFDEDISLEAVGILIDCVLHPAIEGDGFARDEFEIRKNDLLDAIDGEINDKISYALTLASELIYEGEKASYRYYGSRDEVEALTPKSVYEVYKRVLKQARIEILYSGYGDFDKSAAIFENAFEDRAAPSVKYHSYSKLKDKALFAEQVLDVSQANMVLAFKTDSDNHVANRVMTSLYGGGYSKLFENVREKMSLCYFCDASYSEVKRTMTVVSAVDFDNVDKARAEIINQLNLIAFGDFTDEELLDKKKQIISGLRSSLDSVSALSSWYYLCTLRNELLSVDEYAQQIMSVSREDIISAAEKMKLDTVFVLKGSEADDE